MTDPKMIVRTLLSVVLIAIGVGGFYLLGTPELTTRPPDKNEPLVVETVIAADHKDGIQFEVDGVVVPFQQIDIAAQVSGRVEFKAEQCRTGRAVKKGDLLLRIEQNDYTLEVKRLTEVLAQADAMINELDAEIATIDNQVTTAEEQLQIDVRQLERVNDLLTRSAASESEVDTARRAELNSRNALQTLQDEKNLLTRRRVRLESAKVLEQTNLDKAQLALDRTEIKSPLDGVVVSESVEQDGHVQSGSTVITLQDTSQLDVTCKLHMRQMNWLWQTKSPSESSANLSSAYDFPNTPADVVYRLAGTDYQWKGEVNRYDGAGVDNQTRMVPCRVNVADPLSVTSAEKGSNPPTLMTGMFVKVRIDARPPISLVRLPQAAIQPGNAVWTVEQGQLKRKVIAVANSDEEFVVAYQQEGGLQAGDAVVISPLATPIEGLSVTEATDKPAEKQGANRTKRQGRAL